MFSYLWYRWNGGSQSTPLHNELATSKTSPASPPEGGRARHSTTCLVWTTFTVNIYISIATRRGPGIIVIDHVHPGRQCLEEKQTRHSTAVADGFHTALQVHANPRMLLSPETRPSRWWLRPSRLWPEPQLRARNSSTRGPFIMTLIPLA